jgi:hypothetical protein
MIWKVRILIAALGAVLISLCGETARSDMITITGTLTSDGSAIGSGDPVITNSSTINTGDPFSIALSYDPASHVKLPGFQRHEYKRDNRFRRLEQRGAVVSQTDLRGTLGTAVINTLVPEPSSIALLAFSFAGWRVPLEAASSGLPKPCRSRSRALVAVMIEST